MNEYQVINGVGIIPTGAISIEKYAFERNKDITSIVIPDTVKRIEWGAFQSCTNLREVIIPDSVDYIGHSAFITKTLAESFCAESIEWKSRSRDSGVGAETKLVLRSIA